MTLVGCDLHTRQQQVAVLDTETGERYERHLSPAGDAVEQMVFSPSPTSGTRRQTTAPSTWLSDKSDVPSRS